MLKMYLRNYVISMNINKYKVVFEDGAIEELEEIYNYIFEKFKSDVVAKMCMEKIENCIMQLEKFPYSHAEVHIIPRKNIYRKLVIENYVILYKIEENCKTVFIYHIFYYRKHYLI